MRRNNRVFGLKTVLSALVMALCLQASAGEQASSTKSRPLSEVVSKRLTGLETETEADRKQLLSGAKDYLDYKKWRMNPFKRIHFAKNCSTSPEVVTSPFCELIHSKDARGSRARRARRRPLQPKIVLKAIANADLTKLGVISESDLTSALKKLSDVSKLERVVKTLLDTKDCNADPALPTALGLRLEGELPAPAVKAQVIGLYEKSVACGFGLSSVRAGYRLGLMQIWDKKPADAEKTFARIFDLPESADYRSRISYWRLRLARELKSSKLAAEMEKRLVAEFSLSFHGMLGGSLNSRLESGAIEKANPTVLLRSQKAPHLNRLIAAAEALQEHGATEFSFGLLERTLDRAAEAEPELKLYLAVLLMRSGDTLKKFNLLAGLFRERPDFISRSSLEMLYPLKSVELVERANSAADPLLVMSLIRQESAFNERARSRAGAVGLMQVMPYTARAVAGRSGRRKLHEPETNVKIGVLYFNRLIERFGGDAELALAGYNAGPERVDEWLKRYPVEDRILFLDLIPFRETRDYVASIARNYYWYLKLYPGRLHKKTTDVKMPALAMLGNGPGA